MNRLPRARARLAALLHPLRYPAARPYGRWDTWAAVASLLSMATAIACRVPDLRVLGIGVTAALLSTGVNLLLYRLAPGTRHRCACPHASPEPATAAAAERIRQLRAAGYWGRVDEHGLTPADHLVDRWMNSAVPAERLLAERLLEASDQLDQDDPPAIS